MPKIKIVSNPYDKAICYFSFNEQTEQWDDIKDSNPHGKLMEVESGKNFLPFKIREVIDTIIDEYYVGTDKVKVFFEGTQDDYAEVEAVCLDTKIRDKIELFRTSRILENARDIFRDIKLIFDEVQSIIKNIVKDDENVKRDLNKISDALNDIIPICVFGNYSAGKSTFINALIGSEVLPRGGDPVTAKIYEIKRSTQSDRARIKFGYQDESIEISFEGEDYRVLNGNQEGELIQEINKAVKECKERDLVTLVHCALELINGFEKKDKKNIVISNVIELEIPFSKKGVLGQSYNNFVIFDTPGSNSASNTEHAKVLAEALEDFSNGIPVWISQYDTIDSEDNANLCDKIFAIKALDKRFTMIVVNKADGADLSEDGFSKEKIQEFLEYNAVEKMYAGGIYFVSSIMGLGAKNSGILMDKHYRKTYRSQQEMYSDPEDMDYVSLYKYNIMPEQMKNNAVDYSLKCPNLIYANSGVYCVEMEMENFASKHSAYNKCQMVYTFLNDVIQEANRRIETRTETLKRTRETRTEELESDKSQLIDNIRSESQAMEEKGYEISKVYAKSYVEKNLDYSDTVEHLTELDRAIRNENSEKSNFPAQEKGFEESKNMMFSNLKQNGQRLFQGKFIDSAKSIVNDLAKDVKELQENKERKDSAEREIDKATSDRLIKLICEKYRKNILDANNALSVALKEQWFANAQAFRDRLITIITETEALSVLQRDEISRVIMDYEPLDFDDDAENIFIKERFLRGNIFGLKLSDSERLNIKRLTNSYNDKLNKNINEIADSMNNNYFGSFKNWKQNLLSIIEENITEYNPRLRDKTEMIKEETEKIIELENDQRIINLSLKAIKELMDWKILE